MLSEGRGVLIQECVRCKEACAQLALLQRQLRQSDLFLFLSEMGEHVGTLRVECGFCKNQRWVWSAEGSIVAEMLAELLESRKGELNFRDRQG